MMPSVILIMLFAIFVRAEVGLDSGPRFTKEPTSKLEFVNTKGAKVDCLASGNPPPTVNWTLIDGSPITTISGLRHVTSSGTLVFDSFRSESFRPDVHSTVYRCVASNHVGKIRSADVTVRGVVLQTHEVLVYDSYAIEGNSAVFKCHVPTVLGNYMSVTAWIKNDNILIQHSVTEVLNGKFGLMPTGELHIHNVSLGESGSRYKCKMVHKLTGGTQISSTDGQLFVTESRALIAPKIIDSSSSVSVLTGQTAVLACLSQGNPLPTARWYKKGSTNDLIPLTFDKRIVKADSVLIIKSSTKSDSGTYVCEVSNELGKETSDIQLTITEPLSVKLEPSVRKTTIGERVVLECKTSGNVASIMWYHDGVLLKDVSESTLLIESVRLSDRGMYQCIVKIGSGDTMQATSELILAEVPPQLTEMFKELTVQPGASVTLHCVASGIPRPSIQWNIYGIPATSSPKLNVMSSVEVDGKVKSTLKLDKVIVKDGGLYSCVASSESGQVAHSARVNVYGPLGVHDVSKVFAVSGQNMYVNCPIYGYPIMSVEWEKDKKVLRDSPRLTILKNGTLIGINADKNNAGTYSCSAENGGRQSVTASVEVIVMVAPKIVPFEFQDELLREGMRARLQCVVSEGDLPLNVTWLKDGKPLSPELGVLVRVLDEFSSILTVNSITPGHNGKYVCVASNRAATVTHAAELSVNVAPKIVPFTFGDILSEGFPTRVVCGLQEGDGPIQFSWLRDGVPLTKDDTISVHEVDGLSSILFFGSLSAEHAGIYTCFAKNKMGIDRHEALLSVNVPPKVVPFSFQDEHLVEGQLARVSCIVSRGDLPLKLVWEKDGIQLQPDSLEVQIKSFDEHSSILSIAGVSPKHNGVYSCVARNGAGFARHSAQLTVNVPPQWISEPEDIAVLKGQSAVLHCNVRGYPQPEITWMKSNDASLSAGYTSLTSANGLQIYPNGSLVINAVNSTHEGYYSCDASNGIGTGLSGEAQIKILAPPFFQKELTDKNVALGTEVILECFTQGDCPMKITWFRDGKIVQEGQTRLKIDVANRTASETGSLLTIHKVAREDSATYECVAENKYGTNRSSGKLRVVEPPNAPQDLKASVIGSRTIELSWRASFDGNDKVKKYIIQYKLESDSWDNAIMVETVNGEPTNGIVSQLQPATGYIFRLYAENSQGRSPTSQLLRVTTDEDVPSGAPVNIQVEPVNVETFKVLWTAPEEKLWNGKILGYYVGYKEVGTDDPYLFKTLMTIEPNADDLSVQIGGLKQFTKYSVVVLAYNGKGKGPQSEPSIVMTSEGAPSVAPTEVHCTTLTSQSIHVTWTAPPLESVNGILRGYKLVYKMASDWFDDVSEISVVAATTSVTLNNLTKFQSYDIEVQALTKAGDGPKSKLVACKTLDDVPESPMDIKAITTSENSITVSWKLPKNPNGVLKSFSVYWREADSNKDASSHKVPSQLSHYAVSRLEKGRQYEFWVTASTLAGEGSASKIVVQTPSGSKISAKVISYEDKIFTNWQSDVNLACLIAGQPEPQRKWQFKGSIIENSGKVSISNDGTLTLKNVREGNAGDYTCYVQNELGEDKITYTVVVLSPPAVVSMEIVSITSNSFEVQWKPPSSKMSRIMGYTLFVKQEDGIVEPIKLGSEVRTYKKTDLNCGTKYEVSMLASNKIGISEASDPIIVSTNGSAPIAPKKDDLLEETSSTVSLYLNTWKGDGCPIHHFSVEYAWKSVAEWTFVSNNVRPEQRRLVIPGLKAGTWYSLRMTAHNSAGSTVAKYDFATLTIAGATISPELQADAPRNYEQVDSLMAQLNFYLIVPVICTAVILMAIMGVACMCVKLKRSDQRRREVDQRLSAAAYELKRGDSSESFNYLQRMTMNRSSNAAKHFPTDITPYATLQLHSHGTMMSTMSRHCNPPPLPPPRFDEFSGEVPQLIDTHNFFPPGPSFLPGDMQGQLVETTFIFPNETGENPNSVPPGYQNELPDVQMKFP